MYSRFICCTKKKIPLRHIIIRVCCAHCNHGYRYQHRVALWRHNTATKHFVYTPQQIYAKSVISLPTEKKLNKWKTRWSSKKRYTRKFLAVLKHALIARCVLGGTRGKGNRLIAWQAHYVSDRQMDKLYIVYTYIHTHTQISAMCRRGGRQQAAWLIPPIAIRRTVFQVSGAYSAVLALAQYIVVCRNPAGGKKMLPCLFL